jgi:hypothetical protein
MKQFFSILTILTTIYSCSNGTGNNGSGDSITINTNDVPVNRATVNPDAIKTYQETVKSFETTDNFKVALFETKQTFNYLISIRYKELNVTDTLHVPDFGSNPSVEIIKGDSIRPSCIIGYYDKENQFKESKLIYFKGDKLKVKVLKYYAVYTR